VSCPYWSITGPGVELRRERVESIDPHTRAVVTDAATHEAEILVAALGVDFDSAATPRSSRAVTSTTRLLVQNGWVTRCRRSRAGAC
jgi:hypothetical protein